MNAVPLKRYDPSGFHIAELIREAVSDAERAAMLLRVPDEVAWEMGGQLINACGDSGFRLGVSYLVARAVAGAAIRDERGRLPELLTEQVDSLRRALCTIAGVAQ